MATDPKTTRNRQVDAFRALLAGDDSSAARNLGNLYSEALVEIEDAARELARMAQRTRVLAIRTHVATEAETQRDAKAFMPPVPDTPPDWPVGC